MMSSVKSTRLPLLVFLYLLYIADSHPNTDLANVGCECTLKRNTFWSKYVNVLGPIYQCQGCCFSRAFPTPLKTMKTMSIPKNITSEASCCVAQHHNEIQFDEGITVNNHTSCHCSTCFYHKQ